MVGYDAALMPLHLNLLENDEVIAVGQDPLGKEATTVAKTADTRVYSKPLADGSTAGSFQSQ